MFRSRRFSKFFIAFQQQHSSRAQLGHSVDDELFFTFVWKMVTLCTFQYFYI